MPNSSRDYQQYLNNQKKTSFTYAKYNIEQAITITTRKRRLQNNNPQQLTSQATQQYLEKSLVNLFEAQNTFRHIPTVHKLGK